LLARDQAALDQESPDRHIGMAVLPVIADSDRAAPVQPDPARSLDLQKKRIDRIVDPEELEPPPRKRAILYVSARRKLRSRIGRLAVKWRLVRAMTLPRAIEFDLVISGEQSFQRSVVCYGKRSKTRRETLPGRRIVPRRQR